MDRKTVEQLREWYRNLKETGSNTGTFFKVQGRNLGISPYTVYKIASGRYKYTWEREEKGA